MKDMNLILGSMNFGPQVNIEGAKKMSQYFHNSGYNEIDTAYVYNEGETEIILGETLSELTKEKFKVATKVHPRITGRLDSDAIEFQFTQSLQRMKLDMVEILYLHFPDKKTPVQEALIKCTQLYKQGKIKELGLSNFPAWKVIDIWHLCDKNGWLKPTVYQGMYNGLCRNVEPELFPALRSLSIRFYAYNPLAGGMLTGKHTDLEVIPLSGRFHRLESYRKRYWKKNYFEAVNILLNECKKENIQPAEAAFRWLANHSKLEKKQNDSIIIGASNLTQLKENIFSSKQGELPENILVAFNEAWDEAKTESPNYFQFYPK